jgi:Porin PorA
VPKTEMDVAEGIKGYYTDDKQLYVDQLTGSVINQVEHQVRTDLDGNPVIDLHIKFTDDQIQKLVDEARTADGQLTLIRKIVPIVGYVVGVPLFLIGLFLTLRGRKKATPAAS